MEKLLYLVYPPEGQPPQAFASLLKETVARSLLGRPGLHSLRISLADSAVEAARELRMQSSAELPGALLSLWLDTCTARQPVEQCLGDHGLAFHGYLVTESEPLPNTLHPAVDGARTYGMNQVAILQKPARLGYPDWLELWQGQHTRVAIETQSTFAYRQNVIVRALTPSAPAYDAIVEEGFPPEAMRSRMAFYAAGDDASLLQANLDRMMESCARFIDFERIDVIPMSEYVFRG